jgi:A/G-specific adenine glycosylase
LVSIELQKALIEWYREHKRDLPWRKTQDPYSVWVSEIMLQQTQVATVIPYYERWMKEFPTQESLADASDEDALALWQGLGYYRRARLLLAGVRFVRQNGTPNEAQEWLKVPGVGAYTAGAISSIAQNQPAALVDGNVARVFSRLTANSQPHNGLMKECWHWAKSNFNAGSPAAASPRDWNQALMELGATVCKPTLPRCTICPVKLYCEAKKRNLVSSLPTAKVKSKPIPLQREMVILRCDNNIAFIQSLPGEWWEGLYILPEKNPTEEWQIDLGEFTFVVTNHRIRARVSLVQLKTQIEGFVWKIPEDIPIPAPFRRALKLAN